MASRQEIIDQIRELAAQSNKVAAEMDLGPERVEMFSISNMLRKLTRRGFAEECEELTNPLLRELRGEFDDDDPDPEDWDSDFWEEEDDDD